MSKKFIYTFGNGTAEGSAEMKPLLGGKGANLAEMASLGLPVPPGFTISTAMCHRYYEAGKKLPDSLMDELKQALHFTEQHTGREFGSATNPLLVSVRSGAPVSMPGMMDTVLNLGLNDESAAALADQTNNARFAYDAYRRFIQMFADVVMGIEHHLFEEILDEKKLELAVTDDTDLTAEDWQDVIVQYKALVQSQSGEPFPTDPLTQLKLAISAVFSSWHNQRAVTYRRLHDIPSSMGTAVTVQSMVFGNQGDDCATGVVFTRDPSTGEKRLYGEYLINAQGEDVVAGIRTPKNLTKESDPADPESTMEATMPEVFQQLVDTCQKLESHYRDLQDVEFTVESGKLWMLQTRNGKRSAAAAVRVAVELVKEGILTPQEAVLRVDPEVLDQLLHPQLDPNATLDVLTRGLPASPGAASGVIVFTADEAESLAKKNEKVLLVRLETSPEDIQGMHSSEGILTARGGMTSHAAVVARGMGKPCICGAGELKIDYTNKTLQVGNVTLTEGDYLTINGSSGEVIRGEVPTLMPEMSGDFETLIGWADEYRRMRVRANAETPDDAATARKLGAEGIGLCRTEHMFFDKERITAMRALIVSEEAQMRQDMLAKLLPYQQQDFEQLFTIMKGLPLTIRLLDPPLHEFLPVTRADCEEVAKLANVSVEQVEQRCHSLEEQNPMLGHRGCRLGITFPALYEMQLQAIFAAALAVSEKEGTTVTPEIMFPLVMMKSELTRLCKKARLIAEDMFEKAGRRVEYQLGTMIELPAAALIADELAEEADFFSFGTNDLTQTTLGLSRDDAGKFLEEYRQQGLLEQDPFVTIDRPRVGRLVQLAAKESRRVKAHIKLGICGEQAGNPPTIQFCEETGLDYVSCSPFRVPVARLAAAQAALRQGTEQHVTVRKVG